MDDTNRHTIKGPITINANETDDVLKALAEAGVKVNLPFDATGWKSDKMPIGVTVDEPADADALPPPLKESATTSDERTSEPTDMTRTTSKAYPTTIPAKESPRKPTKAKTKKPPYPKAYRTKLTAIQGIGQKTVDDILAVYPTEKSLKKAVADKEHLPVRNDIERKLIKAFG